MHGHLWVWGLACGMHFHGRWRAGGRQPLWGLCHDCLKAHKLSGEADTLGSSDVHFLLIPGGSDGKESACNAGDGVQSLGGEDPLEKGIATHFSILARRIP